MNGLIAFCCLRLAQFLRRHELKWHRYNVAPREMMPAIKNKMMRALAVRISAELRLPNRSAFFTLFFGLWMALAGCATNPRNEPALADRNIASMAVLPPEARVELFKYLPGGDTAFDDKALQTKLSDLIGAELRRRGLVLKDAELDEDFREPAAQSPYFSLDRLLTKVHASLQATVPVAYRPLGDSETYQAIRP